jgi:catechol 2,3-dioxygenase-like lactoylglutathione lyase family enzyme
MFDHIGLKVKDLAKSRRFYAAALAPLGGEVQMQGDGFVGIGPKGKPALWLTQGEPQGTAHIAFFSKDRGGVGAFHRAAVAAGGQDNGAPGLRAHYHKDYYGAFVIDPDGNNVEAVCHKAE